VSRAAGAGAAPAPGDGEPGRGPDRSVLRALVVLTLIAGLVDAVAFLALEHVFAANMTGNLVVLGFAIAGEPSLQVGGPLLALFSFLGGAAVFGWLDHSKETRHQMLGRMMRIEVAAAALAVVVAIGFEAGDDVRRLVITALLAGAMGFRNGTIRRVAIPELRTTVLTLSIAGFAADEAIGGRQRASDRLRFAGIVAMLAGAIISALLVLNASVAWALALIAAVELAALALLGRAQPEPSPA
jgi:uncharacterized membrane protein YoaK (UPF0700 family)